MEYQDISWRECNIHDNHDEAANHERIHITEEGTGVQTHESGECEEEEDMILEEDKDFLFQLFSSQNENAFDTLEYKIPISVSTCVIPRPEKSARQEQDKIIQLRGYEEINNSTGLSMWLGSELLTQYILQNPHLIRDKNVLELGSGLGLCGIVSHYVGAKSVLLTDGDVNVLSNLRYNTQNNIDKSFYSNGCDDRNFYARKDNNCDDNLGSCDGCTSAGVKILAQEKIRVSCPQLIWGNETDKFKQQFGKSNVILAADCIYMTQSIEPMWKTINELIEDEEISSDCGGGVVLYTNRSSSSARAPIEMIFDAAARYGFTWNETTLSNTTHAIGDDSIISGQVYEFRRTGKRPSP